MDIRQKLILTPLAALIFVGGISLLSLDRYLKDKMYERVYEELLWLAQGAFETAALQSSYSSPEFLDKIATRLKLASGARITFLDDKGTVLADSNIPLQRIANLDNHINRPEIKQAKLAGIGKSSRYSESIRQGLMYVAVYRQTRDASGNLTGYFTRTSMSQASMADYILHMRIALGFLAILALFMLCILSVASSRWINAGVVRDRKKLEALVDERTRDINLLQNFGALLIVCTEFDEANEVIQKVMPQLLPESSGAMAIFDQSKEKLHIHACWGKNWQGTTSYAANDCWALRKGNIHYSSQSHTDLYCEHMIQHKGLPTVCVPLTAQKNSIGVLHIINPGLEKNKTQLIVSIAEQIGLTMENIKLRVNLRQQAIRDPLTSLYNRRYLMETIKQIESQSKRNQSSVGVIMLDLDHFKNINDNYGHEAGDLILKTVAAELKSGTRDGDLVCRIGGEEICIVCVDADIDETHHIAEKLLVAVRDLKITYEHTALSQLTFSAGIAVYPDVADSIEEAIHAADQALYRAKNNGRNRVEVISDKTSLPTLHETAGKITH